MQRIIRREQLTIALIAGVIVWSLGCKRVVDIERPYPELPTYCYADEAVQGRWVSDSVHIITDVDTIDSQIVNTRPTLTYIMEVTCDEMTTEFLLQYQNFGGVTTEDVRSMNFEVGEGNVFVYGEQDEAPDTTRANFVMRYQIINDTLLNARYVERPNPGQTTRYRLFLRKRV